MTEKTTVGINKELRKSIKRLAAWLDISQGEVIKRAIKEYEKIVISNKNNHYNNVKNAKTDIQKLFQKATEAIWAEDPETKRIQQKLIQGPESIDDFIINNWDSGLEP